MNFTVGPLPPAVYWRRRALVLGGLALLIILVVYSCSGPSVSDASGRQSPSPTPNALNIPVIEPSASVPPPVSASPLVSVSAPVSPMPSLSSMPTATDGTLATCTDSQIRVTPVIASTSASTASLVHGGTFDLKLKVRNISGVICTRDVGGVPEELRVMDGKTLVWSSDDCIKSQGKPHDVRTFAPDVEIYAEVKWSSYQQIKSGTCTKTPLPVDVGKYTLVGRVGTATASVPFTIVK